MKLVRSLFSCMLFLFFASAVGQAQTSPAQAFDNVTVHTADGETIFGGTIVWRNGVIQSVGRNIDIPFDAYVIDGGDSLHVYPGFIDGMALWGSPDLPKNYEKPERPGDPGYARAGIQPERKPAKLLNSEDDSFESAQKHGFTTAVLGLKGQMLPGQVDLFFLNGSETGDYLMKSGAGLLASFENAPGGFGNGAYPATTMGVMAQLRQVWYDAEALMSQEQYFASTSSNYPSPDKDEVLEALYPVMNNTAPFFYIADTEENIERVFWLQDELGFEVVLVSGKEAYMKSEELKERDIPVLASIDLPEEPAWKTKEKEAKEDTTQAGERMEELTEEMRVFRERQAEAYKADIENVQKLLEAGVRVGYASNGMKLSDLSKHIKTILGETELSEKQLLAMFSKTTAEILGVGKRVGDVSSGHIASFSVFTKPFTEEKAQVKYSVSAGKLSEYETKSSKKENDKEE